MTEHLGGGCLCKAVRFELSGPMKSCTHCHCESCRRATSSPFTTWFTVRNEHLVFSGLPAAVYHSSPGVTRQFCPRCGSPISYSAADRPGETDLYAACLDDHRSLAPEKHVFWSEHVSWVELADHLPRVN